MTMIAASRTSIASFPEAIHLHVLAFLDEKEIVKAFNMNALFNRLASADFLWKPLTMQLSIQISLSAVTIKKQCLTWKQPYTVVHAEKRSREIQALIKLQAM